MRSCGFDGSPTEALRRPTEGLHPKATPTDDVAQNRAPSLLYPILAWPSFADDIFWPTDHSSWPFSYQSIFDQAFAEYPAKRVADLCPRQLGKGDATLRIGRAIAPTAAQEPLLQKLGTALAQANGYLIKSCPAEIPPLPVERLRLMDFADRRDDHGARDRPRPLAEIRAIVRRHTACTALRPHGERANLREEPGASQLAHADTQAGPATYRCSRGRTK